MKNGKNSHTPKICRILSTRFIQPSWHHQDDEQLGWMKRVNKIRQIFGVWEFFQFFM
jgi:hypothetical protein